jgi:2-dehydropantoate 2-reductase
MAQSSITAHSGIEVLAPHPGKVGWHAQTTCTYRERMRICILGAGAIGGLLGARLAIAGQEVSVLARGDTLAAIRTGGLTLVEPDGAVSVAKGVVASADAAELGPQDVVVLALKAHQIAEIAERLPALYDDRTVVVPVQNGIPWWFFQKFPGPYEDRRVMSLDPDGTIERHIPADRIVGCIAYPAAERDAPGVIRLVEGDRFPVGELDGARSDRVTGIAEAFAAAGFTSRVLADIRAHLWVKAWGNLALNPISALTGGTLGQICRWPATRNLAAQMMGEAAKVAEALGLRLRISIDQRLDGAAAVGEHKTSMLQDVEAGRALEIDPLIGAFVELGRLTGTQMPATESVYSLVSLLNARLTGTDC